MDFKDLNDQQLRAVKTTAPVCLVVAGPGSGKTKTLVSRILYLIQNQSVDPSSILAITFTKKAAAEIKERLIQNSVVALPAVHTFHSFALDVLRKHLPQSTVQLLIPEEQRELINQIITDNKLSYKLRDAQLLLTQYKSVIEPKGYDTEFQRFITLYQQSLENRRSLDFDDILLKTFELLFKNEKNKEKHQKNIQYILVDEFQDTNEVQYSLVKQLLGNEQKFFVIGDPQQSIYRFRGAAGNVFDRIKRDFPVFDEILLKTNYRSTRNVVEMSNQFFPMSNTVQPYTQSNGSVELIETVHEFSEADWITNKINSLIGGVDLLRTDKTVESQKGIRFRDFAVIYRTHSFVSVLEEKFHALGLPYQIIGQDSPYATPPFIFILSCLRYIQTKEIAYLLHIPSSIYKKLKVEQGELKEYLTQLSTQMKIAELIEKIIDDTKMLRIFKETRTFAQQLQQFYVTLSLFEREANPLAKFLTYFSQLEENEYYDPAADRVSLMTMHAAKGLEFAYVFICGFEEGIIPLRRENTEEELAEERRLFYVALTRAKDSLYILKARERNRKKSTTSSFYSFIRGKYLQESFDEAIPRIEKKRKEYVEKKSQMKMF